MNGNALTQENREKTRQARVMLEALKDLKLRVRAEKYKDQTADLKELFGHLESEMKEAEQARYLGLYTTLALEIADISNCCDLIIAEILPVIDDEIMKYYE